MATKTAPRSMRRNPRTNTVTEQAESVAQDPTPVTEKRTKASPMRAADLILEILDDTTADDEIPAIIRNRNRNNPFDAAVWESYTEDYKGTDRWKRVRVADLHVAQGQARSAAAFLTKEHDEPVGCEIRFQKDDPDMEDNRTPGILWFRGKTSRAGR